MVDEKVKHLVVDSGAFIRNAPISVSLLLMPRKKSFAMAFIEWIVYAILYTELSMNNM